MKRKNKISSLFAFMIAIVAILAVVGACSTASAETLVVDPEGKGDYTGIQEAVNAANPRDTILVNPGTYEVNLKVDRELKIWSDSRKPGDTIIRAADLAENAVEIGADRVTFSGFGIEGSEKAGVYLKGADNCYINNNEISGSEYGIHLENSSRNVMSNNVLSLNEIGIRLEASGKNTIQTNVIAYNYGYGVSLAESTGNQIYDNYFKNVENVEENAENQENFWSIALTTKKNIVGGPYIAGNFWADLEDTGYSETCTDENSNGLCDSPYEVKGGGNDQSPLYPKVPAAITALESRLDPTAYEEGLASRGEEELDTETPEEGGVEEGTTEEEAEEAETETEPEGEEEEATEEEAAGETNGAPGPGLGIAVLAAGAAYLLRKKK
ncbi:cell surface protein [Methanosarcina sp. KYL-1]|uniref:right-handed parallel beta-helix repeat-containing protein n=1 Tax=Methanosarcina sp. KYL-1 TaxID=2602068 RepID=UPI0021010672|nr:NosD domain-containing protein [Methanosarcina sp. KYL-1]MCQ1534572.1 cell surface protein [Methanosarcina sp. KYL-1]